MRASRTCAARALLDQLEISRLLETQFEVLDRSERDMDAALRLRDALRQAILRKALTG